MLFDYFDKAYYINLDHRPQRRQEVETELARLPIVAERVPGLCFAGTEPSSKLAHVGCKLTHLSIILSAQRQGLRNVLILEDDVKFAPGFLEVMQSALVTLRQQDWDLFYAGYSAFGYDHERATPVGPNLGRCASLYLTHCYAVNACAFARYIEVMLESRLGQGVDSVFVHNADRFNVFCTLPRIAFQRPGYSDIDHRVREAIW